MEGGYSRKLLDLIPNERNWLVKKEDDHGDGDEKKLELRLGPPGVDEDWSAKNKPKPANTSQKRCAPAPVVGWPPIRSFRKNIASSSSSKQSPPSDSQNGVVSNNVVKSQKMVESSQKGLFVKINMVGIPIGRKVDLSAYDSYEKLSVAVDQLFRGLLAAQNDTSGTGVNGNLENEKAITGLLDGSGEYTLVYEDNEGDRMLVGDVPWHMFVSAVKRLRVIKSSEISSICMGSKQEKVNAAMNLLLFFGIAGHEITVVGADGAYTKPLKSHYGVISPGQSIDVLFKADQPIGQYYFAARPYNSQPLISFDNTTTTAIFEYKGYKNSSSKPVFPHLPKVSDTSASVNFTGSFRSLASRAHPIDVPMKITRNFLYTISINTLPCPGNTCLGPQGLRFAASVNNLTFDPKRISILNAYYGRINGVYGDYFPRFPPELFNFTSSNISTSLETPLNATEVQVLNYGDTVQLVIQGTNVVAGIDHPMHLHGHSFYVVGWGLGNYNKSRDPLNFNLVDPPLQQTIAVPKNGWTAIRFKADNPGVWLMHCHLERHISWGMETVFITKNGAGAGESLLPPPPDMPPCT